MHEWPCPPPQATAGKRAKPPNLTPKNRLSSRVLDLAAASRDWNMLIVSISSMQHLRRCPLALVEAFARQAQCCLGICLKLALACPSTSQNHPPPPPNTQAQPSLTTIPGGSRIDWLPGNHPGRKMSNLSTFEAPLPLPGSASSKPGTTSLEQWPAGVKALKAKSQTKDRLLALRGLRTWTWAPSPEDLHCWPVHRGGLGGGPFSTLGRRIFIVPNRPASGTLLFSTAERRPPEGRTSRRERKGHRYDADMSKPRARILEWWAPLSTGMTGFGDPFREAMPGIPAGLRLFTMYPMYRFPPP